jgi:glycosyltransferase involved in cell wall biosynthesis
MSEPRVLIISHGHPDFSLGGGEISAHADWKELRRRGVAAMLLARSAESPGHTGASIFPRSQDGYEYLVHVPPVNHFRHSQPDGRVVYLHFREVLEEFRPTVIHFHHYVHLGLEFIREARKYSPDVSIIVTLHEFLAICHAQGQMVKTSGMLCRKAAPLDCHGCFPEIPPQDFFMRELFIKSFFNLADRFICPSEFLRQRYISWGLPAEKTVVIENGQPLTPPTEGERPAETGCERRFAVIGQLSRLKGTLVLLEAARLLPRRVRARVRIEINGSLQYAEASFKAELAKCLRGLEETVRLNGAYLPEHVAGIVRRNGWVIVPSIWWENSPVVIQEAFAAGRPVICSDIGGMAEKVKDGVTGFHFRVNNPADLAARIEECADRPEVWREMCSRLPRPPSVEETVDRLLELYGQGRSPMTQGADEFRDSSPHPTVSSNGGAKVPAAQDCSRQ